MLALVLPAAGLAQDAEAATMARKNWWDLDRAQRCGRMRCSRVVSRHIPLGPGDPKITLAVIPAADEGAEVAMIRSSSPPAGR